MDAYLIAYADANEVFAHLPGNVSQHLVFIFEFHPELTWRRLTGRAEMKSKKTAAGQLDRIAILNRAAGMWTSQDAHELSGQAALDDILDAISGLAAAHAFLASKRPQSPRNSRGLRMEIWS